MAQKPRAAFMVQGLRWGIEPSPAHPHDIPITTLRFPPTGQFPQFLQTMISVSNVSMRYGAKVLFDDVSTSFAPGKRFGLTGPNESGKNRGQTELTLFVPA